MKCDVLNLRRKKIVGL